MKEEVRSAREGAGAASTFFHVTWAINLTSSGCELELALLISSNRLKN